MLTKIEWLNKWWWTNIDSTERLKSFTLVCRLLASGVADENVVTTQETNVVIDDDYFCDNVCFEQYDMMKRVFKNKSQYITNIAADFLSKSIKVKYIKNIKSTFITKNLNIIGVSWDWENPIWEKISYEQYKEMNK